jgi:hypothetical protein
MWKLCNTKIPSFEDVDKMFTLYMCESCSVQCYIVVIPDTLFYQFNVL